MNLLMEIITQEAMMDTNSMIAGASEREGASAEASGKEEALTGGQEDIDPPNQMQSDAE